MRSAAFNRIEISNHTKNRNYYGLFACIKDHFQVGNAADLLARPHCALFQGISGLQFTLSTVQSPQVPQGGVNCRAGK